MTSVVLVLVVLGLCATAFVLVRGIVTMARGKDITGEQSNRLMSYRVALQFATIVFVVLLIILMKAG